MDDTILWCPVCGRTGSNLTSDCLETGCGITDMMPLAMKEQWLHDQSEEREANERASKLLASLARADD
jgi:hypothetical protein